MEKDKTLPIENEEVVSNKQKFRDNFAAAYPDIDMNDEEAYFGALNDRNDQYAKDKARLEELENDQRKFGEAMDKDGRSAELFLELTKEGGQPVSYLINHYAKEFSDIVNDPDNDEYRKALADKIAEDTAANAERAALETEAEGNIDKSLDALAKVAGEMGLSDEETADAFKQFCDMADDLNKMKVSEEMWRIFVNGLHHDADVESARMEGETAGRNAKISEKLRTEQPDVFSGGGSSTTGNAPVRKKNDLSSSVWD